MRSHLVVVSELASHLRTALLRLVSQCRFRLSPRNLPLNDSMNALSVGLPKRLKSSVTPRVADSLNAL